MADIIDSMISEIFLYTNTGTNIAGRMRNWESANFSEEINCNRQDLWENFEKPSKVKRILKKNKAGIMIGIIALGATALSSLCSNKFNSVA